MSELKPCPFCGRNNIEIHETNKVEPYCYCVSCGSESSSVEFWNNAWAHKEIEGLRRELEEVKKPR